MSKEQQFYYLITHTRIVIWDQLDSIHVTIYGLGEMS